MVSPVTSDAGQRTTSNPTITEGNPAGMPEQPSRHHTSVSCVSCPKDRCQSSLLSEVATDLVASSWRQKSSSHTTPPSISGLAGMRSGIEIRFLEP